MTPMLAAALSATTAVQSSTRQPHLALSLIAATDRPRPGSTIVLGLRFRPDAGWHGYWSNPGDSGLAPTVGWQAPRDVTFSSLEHPAPTVLAVAGLTNFVHAGEHVLLTRATIPATLEQGSALPISAEVRWLACSATLCVPEHATVRLGLAVGDGRPGPDAGAVAAAQAALPRTAPTPLPYSIGGRTIRLSLPPATDWDMARVRFFPDDSGLFDAGRMKALREEGAMYLAAPLQRTPPSRLSGVVSDQLHALRVTFAKQVGLELSRADTASPGETPTAAPAPRTMDVVRNAKKFAPPSSPSSRSRAEDDGSERQNAWPYLMLSMILVLIAVIGAIGWHRRQERAERP